MSPRARAGFDLHHPPAADAGDHRRLPGRRRKRPTSSRSIPVVECIEHKNRRRPQLPSTCAARRCPSSACASCSRSRRMLGAREHRRRPVRRPARGHRRRSVDGRVPDRHQSRSAACSPTCAASAAQPSSAAARSPHPRRRSAGRLVSRGEENRCCQSPNVPAISALRQQFIRLIGGKSCSRI